MTVTVLRAGLDTVEVSFSGELSEESIEMLDDAKRRAQIADGPVPIRLGAVELMMMPTAFGRWSWRVMEPRFSVVAKRKAGVGGVILQARFSSFGLTNEHPDLLWLVVRALVESLGNLKELGVARADVCVDVQGWIPSEADMKNVVCPASYRGTHGTAQNVQTYQFGKRDVLRIYEKSAEILVTKKGWLREVWACHPAYEPESPVWRVEYQATREVLRQVGICSTDSLLSDPSRLLDFGMGWACLRAPTGDKTKTRWPEDPRWTLVRTAVFSGTPLQRRTRVPELTSLDRTKRTFLGAVATAGAYFECTDYWSTLQRLSYIVDVMLVSEEIDFAAMVEEKRRRMLSGGATS